MFQRWQGMQPQNRRWLIVNAILVTAVINFIVNGALGWLNALGLRHVAVWSVPLAQRTSTFTDAIGTFFFLPLTTCLLCTFAVRIEQRRRDLPLVTPPFSGLAARLPRHPFRRGIVLGAVSCAALSPIAALILALTGVGDMSPMAFSIYAALLGVTLGSFVTPIVALLAMTESSTTVTPTE